MPPRTSRAYAVPFRRLKSHVWSISLPPTTRRMPTRSRKSRNCLRHRRHVAKMFQTIAATQQENAREIKDLKELIAGKPYNFGANSLALEVAENSSSFGEVANMFRAIVSYQQENAREIKNMKKLMALIASKQQENAKENKKSEPEQQEDSSLNTSKPCPKSSKQAIISSLVSECLVVLFCFCCDHRVGTRRRKCSHR